MSENLSKKFHTFPSNLLKTSLVSALFSEMSKFIFNSVQRPWAEKKVGEEMPQKKMLVQSWPEFYPSSITVERSKLGSYSCALS